MPDPNDCRHRRYKVRRFFSITKRVFRLVLLALEIVERWLSLMK